MIIDRFKHVAIFQFGTGGTGSWLVPLMVKFIRNMSLRFHSDEEEEQIKFDYFLIDDDIVEQRNILRQNFDEYDVGRKKVSAMARKYQPMCESLHPIDFRPDTPTKFKKLFQGLISSKVYIRSTSIVYIFGCVDDNKPRRQIFSYIKNKGFDTGINKVPIVYFDSGNNLHNGQIVTSAFNLKDETSLECLLGIEKDFYESRFKNPKFFKMFPLKVEDDDDMSCAFFGDQSQTINSIAASLLFAHFQKTMINDLIPPNLIQFNSSGMSTFEI